MNLRCPIIAGWLVSRGLAAPQAVEATETVRTTVLYAGFLLHFLGKSVMNTKSLGQLAAGFLAAMALVAATIALGSSGRDDPPARAAGNFSPYVTKDGGISRPTDYRDTFEYLGSYAVSTKPDKPLD